MGRTYRSTTILFFAGWLAENLRQLRPVVIAPLSNAFFYPAFVEYPGSISLLLETPGDVIVDTCTSLARFGLTRFYVLNTGLTTLRPLAEAKSLLGDELVFDYLVLDQALQMLPSGLLAQSYGSHADEAETSLMLHIAPEVGDVSRAVDDGAEGDGRLMRQQGLWSRSGIFGQATLTSADNGGVIAEHLLHLPAAYLCQWSRILNSVFVTRRQAPRSSARQCRVNGQREMLR